VLSFGPWRGSIRTVLALALTLCGFAPALAEIPNTDGVDAPAVRVNLLWGNVTVRTAERPGIAISADPGIDGIRSVGTLGEGASTFPILRGEVAGPSGPVLLPAESFVSTSLPRGPRDIVTLRGAGSLDLTIPANTALLVIQLGRGSVSVEGYRGGTFLVRVRSGEIRLTGAGGEGYTQILRGPTFVADSSFEHLRARSGLGPIVFERCRARQIEVASVEGAILYDAGAFDPGLARFESQTGHVAIGVNGSSQLGAHSGSGRVYTEFDERTRIEGREGGATAVVGGGGPVVTANSASGNVYLYNGSLRAHSNQAGWNAPRALLRRGEAPPPGFEARRLPRAGAEPARPPRRFERRARPHETARAKTSARRPYRS
jgi:hypothetical protein